jgi:hypothetical protein
VLGQQQHLQKLTGNDERRRLLRLKLTGSNDRRLSR